MSRSRPGGERQAADLRSAGYDVVVAPVLEIAPVPAVAPEGTPPAGPFHRVIFLSEHAVRHGLPALASTGALAGAQIMAVGSRTAAVLGESGLPAASPGEATSEGLLALAELQRPAGERILLVAGIGGRSLLEQTLSERGATVERFECYRRVPAATLDPAVFDCDVIVAASAESLASVAELWLAAGGRADVPVLVPSARVAGHAVEVGMLSLHDCAGADSPAWLAGLERLQRAEPNDHRR